MTYFAKLDENNIVTSVIVADQDFINSGKVGDASLWEETSYSGSFRKNYAGIGYTYDTTRNAFIAPKPYPSWTLNETTCQWEAPVAMPTTELEDNKYYFWNESILNWEIQTN